MALVATVACWAILVALFGWALLVLSLIAVIALVLFGICSSARRARARRRLKRAIRRHPDYELWGL